MIFGLQQQKRTMVLGNSVIGEWCNFGADSNTQSQEQFWISGKCGPSHQTIWNHGLSFVDY